MEYLIGTRWSWCNNHRYQVTDDNWIQFHDGHRLERSWKPAHDVSWDATSNHFVIWGGHVLFVDMTEDCFQGAVSQASHDPPLERSGRLISRMW
jgi:hypothetical protein